MQSHAMQWPTTNSASVHTAVLSIQRLAEHIKFVLAHTAKKNVSLDAKHANSSINRSNL
jgi:hypothetical protein